MAVQSHLLMLADHKAAVYVPICKPFDFSVAPSSLEEKEMVEQNSGECKTRRDDSDECPDDLKDLQPSIIRSYGLCVRLVVLETPCVGTVYADSAQVAHLFAET